MSNAFNILHYLRIPVAATSAIAASLSGLLYWKQNELIYHRAFPPDARTHVPKPSEFPYYGLGDWEELYIPTPDGEKLHGFFIRPSNTSQAVPVTVLMFHGNAGNIGHRIPIVGVLDKEVGVNVLMLEYRGYGFSTGTPDEDGINIDAQTGLDWIRNRAELKNTKYVVYGQSIGGAAAIQLVANNQDQGDIKGLILENTFLSIRKLIPSVMPAARFLAPLCHQLWPSDETLPKIKVPILFLSGQKDEIVPSSHMKRLFELATSPQKTFKEFPDGTHNDTVAAPGYFAAIAEFIKNQILTNRWMKFADRPQARTAINTSTNTDI